MTKKIKDDGKFCRYSFAVLLTICFSFSVPFNFFFSKYVHFLWTLGLFIIAYETDLMWDKFFLFDFLNMLYGFTYGAKMIQVLLIWQLFTYLFMGIKNLSGYNLHNEGSLNMLLLNKIKLPRCNVILWVKSNPA